MMLPDYRARASQKIYAADYAKSVLDVAAHLDPLFLRQRSGLQQYVVGNAYLAYVVEERALLQPYQIVVRKPKLACEAQAVGHNPVRMPPRFNIAGFKRACQRAESRAIVVVKNFEHVVEVLIDGAKL